MTNKRSLTKRKKAEIASKVNMVNFGAKIFIGFILITLSVYAVVNLNTTNSDQKRFDKIDYIYSSLNLDDSYRMVDSDVFGDKRVYDWDDGRTFSSQKEFKRDADRSDTFDDLRERITTAGFDQISGPGYGDAARQDHYKSSEGEYIRVSIYTEALYLAMFSQDKTEYPKPGSTKQLETGPVYVTIKVNLDDNNE